METDLQQYAREMAAFYSGNEKVAGILLAGSVSRGLSDQFSDIELHLLWNEPPSDVDRLSPVKEAGGSISTFYPYEDMEWSETYTLNGIKFEMSHFLLSTVEQWVHEVTVEGNTSLDLQCVVASIADGVILSGFNVFSPLKDKAANYPDILQKRMILENLNFGSRWKQRNTLLQRKDWMLLSDATLSAAKKMYGVLFGLNRKFVPHPGFKWASQSVCEMKVKPDRFQERMDTAMSGPLENRLTLLEELAEEIRQLANEQCGNSGKGETPCSS
ncbi:DUF4037 domain-containing protein [Metabacillus sp. JX24]|uniref:DUF4037 domain-containing protein n=1 Tax=Metabacillus sp. JX24 TaxID=3240759 RepID=UPI00350EB1C7